MTTVERWCLRLTVTFAVIYVEARIVEAFVDHAEERYRRTFWGARTGGGRS